MIDFFLQMCFDNMINEWIHVTADRDGEPEPGSPAARGDSGGASGVP